MRALPLAALALMSALTTTVPAGAREERLAPGSRECISLHAIRDETAEADDRLIFHTGGGKAWRNRLPEPCEGLRSINSLGKLKLNSTNGEQMCVGDSVQVTGRSGKLLGLLGGDKGSGASCKLGQFEPLSEMSLPEDLRR